MSTLLLRFFRLATYLGVTLLLIPVQAILLGSGSALAETFPRHYHRLCWRILGFDVVIKGIRSERRPTLFIANHISYTDITILGGAIGGSFIAKAEVRRWPLFGTLARLQRTVFVERRAAKAKQQQLAIALRLAAHDDLILFPEGTSGDGTRVLPFKSALFAVAETTIDGQPLTVQPVSIAYTRLNGIPLGRARRPAVAWYGDMDMASHLWRLLGLGIVTARVEFHPPVTADSFTSRKALSEACRQAVERGLTTALAGRDPPEPKSADQGDGETPQDLSPQFPPQTLEGQVAATQISARALEKRPVADMAEIEQRNTV